jgi:hypothetical protein
VQVVQIKQVQVVLGVQVELLLLRMELLVLGVQVVQVGLLSLVIV